MRYLLTLFLCLSACTTSREAPASEAASPEATASQAVAASKPSEARHALVELQGWAGPVAELSDATEEGLSRCTKIQMLMPTTEEAPATEEQLQVLRGLFAKVLGKWDDEMSLVPEGCDVAFSDRAALSQCAFETGLGALPLRNMSEEERAFVSEYNRIAKVLVTYKYYNPRTAIDDPLFERQCEQLEGQWTAVSVDSPEYRKALKLYPGKTGSTAEATVP